MSQTSFARHAEYAQTKWHKLNDLVGMICNFGSPLGITPPKIYRSRLVDVKKRSKQKCNLLLYKIIRWIGKNDSRFINRILTDFLSKHKPEIYGYKRFKLSDIKSVELQNRLQLTNNKMRILQRFIKENTGTMLLCAENVWRKYQTQQDMLTGVTMQLKLAVCSRFVNTHKQMPVQELPVYLVDIRDAMSRITSATLNSGTFKLHPTLKQNEIKYCVGYDKSDSGCQGSVNAVIRDKCHGKYGSIITTLTHEKVDEKYINCLEIAKLRNGQSIMNQLLLFPNIIIIGKIHEKSWKFVTFPMIFTPETQKMIDEEHKQQLCDIQSPDIEFVNIDPTLLPKLPVPIKIKKEELDNEIKDNCNDNDIDIAMQVEIQNNPNDNDIDIHVSIPQSAENVSTVVHAHISSLPHKHKLPSIKPHPSSLQEQQTKSQTVDPGQQTAEFWHEKQQLLHFKGLFVVKLPAKFELKFDVNDNGNAMYKKYQRQIDQWITQIEASESQIWHKLTENDKNNKQKKKSKTKSKINDLPMPEFERSRSRDSVASSLYDPMNDLNDLNETDDEIEWERVNRENKNKKGKKKIKFRTYSLTDFTFNKGSRLNRYQQSYWKSQTTHCAVGMVQQNNTIIVVHWLELLHNEYNDSLPQVNNGTYIDFSIDTLFDDYEGISHFWINKKNLPQNHNDNAKKYYTFVIEQGNLIAGIVTVCVQKISNPPLQAERYYNLRQCIIISRCIAYEDFAIDNCDFNNTNSNLCIPKCFDLKKLFDKGATKCQYQHDLQHKLSFWSMNSNFVFQSDNKGKNMYGGIASSSCGHPCAICEGSTDQFYSLTTPQTMSFQTRTVIRKQQQLQAGCVKAGVNRKIDLKKSKGVQNVPIYKINAHNIAATTLHNFEGIMAVFMSSYRDMLCDSRGHKQQWLDIQNQCQQLQDQYEKIIKLQNILTQTIKDDTNHKLTQWITQTEDNVRNLTKQYLTDYAKWEQINKSDAIHKRLSKFVTIMKEHQISLYYFLNNSIQGVMVPRLLNARQELIDLATNTVDQTVGCLLKHLLHNLNYLYIMMKHKSSRNWTLHECATLKQAYIDFYHQHAMFVRLFRRTGSIALKAHFTMHDVTKCIFLRSSVTLEDDERFECVNQNVAAHKNTYARYCGPDKLNLIGRRTNSESLNIIDRK